MTPHLHSKFVPGCYRCNLNLDEVREEGHRELAEHLMSMLAATLDPWRQSTYTHPDDDSRYLTLLVAEGAIERARRELYGEAAG